LRTIVALETGHADRFKALEASCRQAAADDEQAQQRAEASDVLIAAQADQVRKARLTRWDAERNTAHHAARILLDGPGRLGLRRAAVARAAGQLTDWADRWRAHLPDLPADPSQIAQVAGRLDDRPALEAAFDIAARRAAEDAHPEHAVLWAAADAARHVSEEARHSLTDARRRHEQRLADLGAVAWSPDPASRLAEDERDIAMTRQSLTDVRARIAWLRAEPALLAQSADRLVAERDAWCVTRDADRRRQRATLVQPVAPTPCVLHVQPERLGQSVARRDIAAGIGR
jgi:exodeoxyribonuclease V alpha subunit